MALFLSTVLLAGESTPLSVDELIEAHLSASGGRKELEVLRSISRVGKIFFVNYGQPPPIGWGSYRTDLIYPNQLREELRFKDFLIDDCKNFGIYWKFNGETYQDIASQEEKEHLTDTAMKANRDLLWIKKEYPDVQISLVKPTWTHNSVCLVATKMGNNIYHCFDKQTHLLSAKGNDIEHRLFFRWRKIGKIKIPFELRHYRNGKLMYKIELENVSVNEPIDPSRFSMPQK